MVMVAFSVSTARADPVAFTAMNHIWRSAFRLLLFAVLCVTATQAIHAAETGVPTAPTARRILFLGDSITYGGQYVEFVEAFIRLRFPDWPGELFNLGLPSETVSGLSEAGHAGGAFPRPDLHERLDRVLAKLKPDLVIACYGMNDGIYQPLSDERFAAFRNGVGWLREKVAKAGAGLILLTPPVFDPVAAGPGLAGGHNYNQVLDRYAEWLLEGRAQGWAVLDVHGPMNQFLAAKRLENPAFHLAGDGVHPGEIGHWLMALPLLRHFSAPSEIIMASSPAALAALHPQGAAIIKLVQERQRMLKDAWLTDTGHQRPGMNKGLPLAEAQTKADDLARQIRALAAPASPGIEKAPFPGTKGVWNGFERYDFPAAGRTVSVIVPKKALPGRPWAWKGEFLDAFPGVEIALLQRGMHIVYLAAPDLLGSPEAVRLWNECHRELTRQHGLAAKPALIALSRAGLYCYNWAEANPGKVACIYADAAVCDFKSWPGGKGHGKGSPHDWALVMDRYGFKSEGEALAYRGNPVDNLEPLAKARVPLLHVYGDADDVVPWTENTGLVAERYRKLGGEITLIAKPGVGHHPHGLEDPTPVVEFILGAIGK